MKILLDQGTPFPLGGELEGHFVRTAFQENWSQLTNGELLDAAERAGFELLITTDQNIKYQQNLSGRRITIIVLNTTSWPKIRHHIRLIQGAVNAVVPGGYQELDVT